VIEKLKRAWRDGLRDLAQFGRKGFVELQNSVYTESNIAIPAVVSQAQLESHYQQSLKGGRSPDEGRTAEKSSGREI